MSVKSKQLAIFIAASSMAVVLSVGRPLMAQGTIAADSRSYRLINADAATVGPQLNEMLKEYGAAAEVLIDRTQNRLVVRGPEASRQLAVQLIRTLDKRSVSAVVPAQSQQRGIVKGYPVNATQIDKLADALGKQFPASMGVRIAPDTRTSQLVVIAPEDVHRQIVEFLRGTPGALVGDRPLGVRRVPGATTPRYRMQNITWREFERSLRSLWGNNLIITQDAAGEVSLVRMAEDPESLPILRIHRQTNEVSFASDTQTNRSWRQIAIALDRAQGSRGATTQLVPLRRADPAKVREAITAIRDAALRTSPGETMAAVSVTQAAQSRDATNLVSMIFQPAGQAQEGPAVQPPAQPPGGQPEVQPDQDGPPLDGDDEVGLLGDVQIEFIPELGIIILRGNKRDVQRVQAIIDEIERESEATQPEIEVVTLQHTNSEAMTELVTQVYADVYEPRLGSLSITALVKPNAILCVGRRENIETARNLITQLDEPVAPDTQIKVFRLLHMPALNAEQYVRSFYGTIGSQQAQDSQQDPRALSPRLVVIGDYRSNSLIVQASPRDMDEVAKLLQELDVEKTDAKIEVRVFPLQNSLASDMETVLQSTLAGQAGTAPQQQQQTANQQNQASRSVQIVGIDQSGNKIIESGLLTDVTITADDNSNALVVKAPSISMGLIAALVKQLDTIPAAESQIKVFQIENGDATNLTVMLQQLFGQPVTAGQVGVFSQTVGRTFGTAQQLTQTTAGESSLIPLSFAVDARTNSIIASGSRGDLAVVEAILLRLDEGDLRQRKLIVYRLNNAPADFVATALTTILNEQFQLLSQQQGQQFSLISQFELIDQQISVVPETISNTLIVSATPKYYEQITEVIQDLDRRPPMIMIQVVVCLVRLDDNEEMGVELGIQDSLLFDRSTTAGGLLAPGFDFVNRTLGNADTPASLATRGLLAGQAFGSFSVGRSSASEGFPGLVLSASNESINILIRALASKSRAQVLSRPQIMTLNNRPASVLVGQRVPQITDFQVLPTGGTSNSVDLIDVGVSLGVLPRVTPDGLVIMDLEVNDSRVGDPAEGIVIGVSDGVPIQSPIYDDVTSITTVACRDGQTVVFGGLIQTNRTDTFRGIPYLSQVPVVGHLFRFDTRSDERTELIFFLTPHIVMDDYDLEVLNQREAERMSWCLADIIDAHGDPGFRGSRGDVWSTGTPVIYPHMDPTGEGVILQEGMEQVPTPPSVVAPGPGEPGQPPFILPPEERTEGKPFIRPPEERQEGKPFILPPAEREEAKPYLEGEPRQSRRGPQPARVQLQEQASRWQPPGMPNPWQPTSGATTPGSPIPQLQNRAGQQAHVMAPSASGVIPAKYDQHAAPAGPNSGTYNPPATGANRTPYPPPTTPR
jgi:type II secretion system protein D